MNTYGLDLMGRRRRRRHSAEFKAMVVGECRRLGVSVAAVALAHGLNANMLRKWVREAEAEPRGVEPQAAVAEELPQPLPLFAVLRPVAVAQSAIGPFGSAPCLRDELTA